AQSRGARGAGGIVLPRICAWEDRRRVGQPHPHGVGELPHRRGSAGRRRSGRPYLRAAVREVRDRRVSERYSRRRRKTAMGQFAYVRVRFSGTDRAVFMDGGPKSIGATNKKLRVRKMFHEFDLGTVVDYAPDKIGLRVDGSSAQPTEIDFTILVPAPPGPG